MSQIPVNIQISRHIQMDSREGAARGRQPFELRNSHLFKQKLKTFQPRFMLLIAFNQFAR